MHPAVLGATGYGLLLSSLVTFLILLRLGCKRQKKKSPFYILSTSDILSAALTGVVVLLNHIETGTRTNYSWRSNVDDHAWTVGSRDQYRLLPFLQIHDLHEATDDTTNLNATLTCGMKDVLMQHGMLLAALANAFVSLLTFVVQCNLCATRIKQKYVSIVESLRNDARVDLKDARGTNREGGTTTDERRSTSQQRWSKTKWSNGIERFRRRIAKTSKFQRLRGDDERPAGYLITAHWLVPFLVVGILYFAEYDDLLNVNSRQTEDAECIFQSNFPLNDLHVFSDAESNSETVNLTEHATPENNYLVDGELSNSTNAEIDRIVSRVQDIVRILLNYADNSTKTAVVKGIHFRGNSSGNTTEHIFLTNDTIIRQGNDENIDAVLETLYDGTPVDRNATSTEREDVSVTSASRMNNVPAQIDDSQHREIVRMDLTTTEENASHKIADDSPIARNATFLSNHQIYADIIRRIQAASVSAAVENRRESRNDGEQAERNGLGSYTAKSEPPSVIYPGHLSASETDRFNEHLNSMTRRKNEAAQANSRRTINECLLSIEFLKLHLLALTLAIYFLPILFSCILQVRGKHVCENALVMLRASVDHLGSTVFRGINFSKDEPRTISFLVERASSQPRLSTTSDDEVCDRSSMEPREPSPGPVPSHNGTDTEATRGDRLERSGIAMQDQRFTLEIDRLIRILDTLRLSLILCVLLWTPVFLATLLRAFSCIRAADWWSNVTLSSAMSYGIVRNALNVRIVRLGEACGNVAPKDNKVRPFK